MHELALRPEFSAQVRMPPTVLLAPRRRVVWAPGFDCGAGAVLLRALPHRPGGRVPISLNARGSSPLPPRGPNRGTGRPKNHDADRTELGGAQARRVQSRSRIAAALAGSRCATPSERPASGRCSGRGAPGRSKRSAPRVHDAIVRLAGPADAAFRLSGVQDASPRHGRGSRSDWGSMARFAARSWSQSATCVKSAVPRYRATRQHIAHRRVRGRAADRRPRRRGHRSTRGQARTNQARNRTLRRQLCQPTSPSPQHSRSRHRRRSGETPPPRSSQSRRRDGCAGSELSTTRVLGANGAARRKFTLRPRCQATQRPGSV
jgi:hypothetical protein